MNPRNLILIFLFPLLLMSCKKETIHTDDDLKGRWEQIAPDFFLDRESLYFDGKETLYYLKLASRCMELDTLIYGLDEKHERLYLKPADCTMCPMAPYKIQLNIENNELTIWGLHNSSSGLKFKKQ
jgi:hypothetical protein